MKAKNKLLTLLILSAGAAVTTAGINKAIQFSAVSKNFLAEPEPLCFKWRLGNVYYTKEGTGKPLLLIHDLDTCTSGYEWKQLIPFLSSKYTVCTAGFRFYKIGNWTPDQYHHIWRGSFHSTNGMR